MNSWMSNTAEFLIIGIPVWVSLGVWFWEAFRPHAGREKGEE